MAQQEPQQPSGAPDLGDWDTEDVPLLDVKVKVCDMSDDVRDDALQCISRALHVEQPQRDAAAVVKRLMEHRHGKHWHVIVGCQFGSQVTHQSKCFLYAYYDSTAVLLFKTPQ